MKNDSFTNISKDCLGPFLCGLFIFGSIQSLKPVSPGLDPTHSLSPPSKIKQKHTVKRSEVRPEMMVGWELKEAFASDTRGAGHGCNSRKQDLLTKQH